VDEPAEPVPPDDLPGHVGGMLAREGWAQVERPVRPGRVVVVDELAHDGVEVAATENEQPV
jgi:CxxC motif-containing protein